MRVHVLDQRHSFPCRVFRRRCEGRSHVVEGTPMPAASRNLFPLIAVFRLNHRSKLIRYVIPRVEHQLRAFLTELRGRYVFHHVATFLFTRLTFFDAIFNLHLRPDILLFRLSICFWITTEKSVHSIDHDQF